MKFIKILVYSFTKLSMNALSLFLMIQREKYDILFIHKFSNKPTINSEAIIKHYLDNGYNVKELFCEKDSVKNYFLEMYYGCASKVIIIDSFSVVMSNVRCFKKKPVIQIWHSLGAIKTFGYQTVGKKEGRNELVAKHMHMHANYDCVITSGKGSVAFYEEAFKTNKIVCARTPLIDYALGLEKVNNNKKTVLYIPTFRRTKDDGFKLLVDAFDFDNYNLIYQPHKSQHNSFELFEHESVEIVYNQLSVDLINKADIVITDYSAVVFESVLLNKPLYYFLHDYNDYIKDNGLNINVDELPGKVYYEVNDLVSNLNDDLLSYDSFRDKYLTSEQSLFDVIDSFLK